MNRFSQNRYSPAGNLGQGSLLGRILAAAVGIAVIGVSVFVGAIFIAGFIGLLLVGAVIFAVRVWWLKRQMAQYESRHVDLDAEFTVVREETRTIGQKKTEGAWRLSHDDERYR